MKKLIPILIILSLVLSACDLLPLGGGQEPMTDSDMATRVAELLATMTTPTTELVFPPTPTSVPPTPMPTATLAPTAEATVEPTAEPTEPPEGTPATATSAPVETLTATETPVVVIDTPVPTGTLQPTLTGTPPTGDPVLRLGAPTGTDPFDNETKWVWPTGSDNFSNAVFANGYMNLTGLQTLAGWRLPMLNQQVNNYFELTANSGTCSAKDSYGIIFRVPVLKELNQGYLYEVTCDGYLRLWKWDGNVAPKGKATILVNWLESKDVKTGANQVNRLGVMVIDKNIKIYMNGVLQGEATDGSYNAGFFGVFVRAVTTSKYTVKLDEMKYWENPPK